MDLPHPDSPTIASISPVATAKSMSRTTRKDAASPRMTDVEVADLEDRRREARKFGCAS